MPTVLFFHVCTSGRQDFKKEADDPVQPRIIQIAWQRCDLNPTEPVPKIIDNGCRMVFPQGWTLDPEFAAEAGHGITQQRLEAEGSAIPSVMQEFGVQMDLSDMVVGYSVDFHLKAVRGEFRRCAQDDRYNVMPKLCCMRAATNEVRAPNKNKGGYKFPTMDEAARTLLGRGRPNPHDASDDCDMLRQIFASLKQRGVDLTGKFAAEK